MSDVPPIPGKISIIIPPSMETKKYPPVGACIYCGTKEPPLTEEHIIPFAIGDKILLPAASCHKCCDTTKKFEQFVQRTMFDPIRDS
jgi:hypothetical protein